MGDARARAFQAHLVHRIAEAEPIFRLVDRIGIGADEFYAEFLQRPVVMQGKRGIERGLPAHGRQEGKRVIRPFLALLGDDLRDNARRDRFNIGGIGQLRIGHDRCRFEFTRMIR